MSQFVRMIDAYCERYEVDQRDRRKLLIHYPLFKLGWLSSYGGGRVKAVARALLKPFKRYRMVHSVRAPSGRLRVPVSFHEDDLASFKEVFLGDEYRPPFDLSGARSYVDLGANTGMAALSFASRAPLDTIVLVEANPDLVPALHADVAAALPRARVAVENVAIGGASAGDTAVFVIAANHRHSSARSDAAGRRIEVPRLGLRALLDKHALQSVDVLKMDVEGSEHQILSEDADAIARARFLFAEVHGGEEERARFVDGLRALGFVVAERRAHPDCGCETVVAAREGERGAAVKPE